MLPTHERMQFVISQIQSQRPECDSEAWSPCGEGAGSGASTFDCLNVGDSKVGDVPVPEGLTTVRVAAAVKNISSRDAYATISSSTGRVLTYRTSGRPTHLPSDAAICWLYVSDLSLWTWRVIM